MRLFSIHISMLNTFLDFRLLTYEGLMADIIINNIKSIYSIGTFISFYGSIKHQTYFMPDAPVDANTMGW